MSANPGLVRDLLRWTFFCCAVHEGVMGLIYPALLPMDDERLPEPVVCFRSLR
jgi:hypothetical protein